MKKLTLILIVLIQFIMGVIAGPVNDKSDILVKLNFYEGLKGEETKGESVVSSYFLKSLFVGKINIESSEKNESAEIKKIFNLSGINLMSEAKWGWRRGEKKKEFQLLILNGHEFMVEIMMKELPDNFIVKVINRQNKKVLLKSDIILPEKRSSVFGFEDSRGKPFFLSLSRAMGESIIRKEPPVEKIVSVKNPVLIKKVKPVYPKVALRRKITGVVKIEAVCDIYGKVVKTNVISGNPILSNAAIKALKQWVYEPFLINNKPKPVRFTVIVKYNLDGKKKQIKKVTPINLIKNVPNIWPTKGYLTWVFGERVDKKTKHKFFHKGVDIAAKEKSKVIAPANGIVTFAASKGKHGNLIIIDHQNNYISKYAHLYSMKVKAGDKVKKGDVIGLVGSTGQSNGSHLHWEVHFKGKPINPLDLLKE